MEDAMAARLGFVLHLAGCGASLLLLIAGLEAALDMSVADAAPVAWALAAAAGATWLSGWAALYVLAGR
ncbi:hypothetical protein FZ983_17125 [Azospirillum sp. B21]|uniref:hypothetical protein n=1 Tax=Azospirillum sp. B21 TaxID=2607496 RepID=UPI0011EBB1EB|nr:hypothetical protein [Azospirillum sp. B21]KAA0579045.1 hypothetical protein FZ983_17125 [Azospirillum sp. B21]